MKASPILMLSMFVLIMSCEKEYEYKTYDDPTVDVTFLNYDSLSYLATVDDQIEGYLEILDNHIEELDSSLAALEDSISAIEAALDTGNLTFENDLTELLQQYTIDSSDQVITLILRTEYNYLSDSINSIITVLLDGDVKIDYIQSLFNDFVDDEYPDSMAVYPLPLNVNGNISSYEISINGQVYQLALSHTNSEYFTANQAIKIGISELSIMDVSLNPFDSVFFYCPTSNCNEGDSSIICLY
jgi:hypothetical protein